MTLKVSSSPVQCKGRRELIEYMLQSKALSPGFSLNFEMINVLADSKISLRYPAPCVLSHSGPGNIRFYIRFYVF